MPGKCGSTYRIAPTISADPCNALRATPSGLLVPTTAVTGIAPGAAVGTARSVDIDVSAPAADACPAVWTVGARLTPVSGEVTPSGPLDLTTLAVNVWADIPGLLFVAPEAGVYRITADVSGGITAAAQASFNRLVQTRLTVNGAAILTTTRHLVQQNWTLSGGNTMASGRNGSSSTTKLLTLAAGDAVRVQGSYLGATGTAASMAAGVSGGTLIVWSKVAD
ncbi:hypothetical protein [Streptomyces cadmiisoli]|uniref:hypothetical protein n=1 Tax=Streptomyces cadmiisoli TaxID=2184053 RepID=UPI0036596204